MKILNHSPHIFKAVADQTSTVIAIGILGIDPNRLVKVLHYSLLLSESSAGKILIGVGFSIIRMKTNSLGEIVNCSPIACDEHLVNPALEKSSALNRAV